MDSDSEPTSQYSKEVKGEQRLPSHENTDRHRATNQCSPNTLRDRMTWVTWGRVPRSGSAGVHIVWWQDRLIDDQIKTAQAYGAIDGLTNQVRPLSVDGEPQVTYWLANRLPR